jgi:hypothetical protein
MKIPYKFNVSSWKLIKFLGHHQKSKFHIIYFNDVLSYNFFSIHDALYNPSICGKGLLMLWSNFETFIEFIKF